MDNSPRIALIDDDRAWLETLTDYLGAKGWHVDTAQGGVRGLELLARTEAPLVIVDFRMPDLDGLELIRQVRERGQNLRILLVSSEEDPDLPSRALAQGATAFLSKNEVPGRFLKSLAKLLASSQLYRSSPSRFLPVPLQARSWLPVPAPTQPFSRN
ncbi:MAG: response regulator [Gemmataceae bacterium]